MSSNAIAGTYSLSAFCTQNPTPAQRQQQQQHASDLAGSGMGVLVLASMHVSAEGDISFNDTWMIKNGRPTGLLNPELPGLLADILSAGSTIILGSIGGGGTFKVTTPGGKVEENAVGFWDFTHIKNLCEKYPDPAQNPFFINLRAFFDTYTAVMGIDLDLESYTTYEPFFSTVVTIIQWLNDQGKLATIVPYNGEDFWVSVLEKCLVNGKQQVAWVNLQNAQGTLGTFLSALQNANTGWPSVAPYLLCGVQITAGTPPSEVESMFQEIASQAPGLRGGWVWTYDDFAAPAKAYVAAVQQGFATSPVPAAV
jgi:hypothetical protein